jgi:hypothetical protein
MQAKLRRDPPLVHSKFRHFGRKRLHVREAFSSPSVAAGRKLTHWVNIQSAQTA